MEGNGEAGFRVLINVSKRRVNRMEFIHEPNRIYGTDENGKVLAEITFPETEPGVYTIDHTIVDGSLRGQGVAGKLVQAAVDDIKAKGGEVRATCSYAVAWLEKQNRKKITFFYLPGCPYCKNANKAIEELIQENPAYGSIEIERINELDPPAGISGYNYYYVPSMFIGKEKIYEADPSQGYEDIKESVRTVFEKASE